MKEENIKDLLNGYKEISYKDLMKMAGYKDTESWCSRQLFDSQIEMCLSNGETYLYGKERDVYECRYDEDNNRFNFIYVLDFDDNDNIIDERFYI